jgi:hypothetical protein
MPTLSTLLSAALLSIFAFACGAANDCGGDGNDCAVADLDSSRAHPPAPFAMQFSGTYLGAGDSAARLELHTDGSYLVERAGEESHGYYSASRVTSLPLALTLKGRLGGVAQITAFDGLLLFDGETLSLRRPSASDEELCDATGGHWTDDDPDPKSGLYCICADGKSFVPSAGGCLAIARTRP